MKWTQPPVIKIYEALGALADQRMEVIKSDWWLFGDISGVVKAKVYSSSREKYYDVEYNESQNAIMTNDNGSYRKWYLGYPAITLLLSLWKLSLRQEYSEVLKWILWKELNTKNNNDFDKTITEIDELLVQQWVNMSDFRSYLSEIESEISQLALNLLWSKKLPPKGN